MDCGSLFMVWRNFVKQKYTEILHAGFSFGSAVLMIRLRSNQVWMRLPISM